MSDSYSPLKVFHHPGRLAVLRAGGQPVPAQVQIILSDLCQQSCHFCAYRADGYTTNELFHVLRDDGTKNHNPNRMIPTAKVLEILDDCKAMGVGAIQYTGGGEPTLHPDHPALFTRTLDLGLDLALVTNGVVWRPRAASALARAKWVRFSVDAGTPETYARIRGSHPSTFDQVFDRVAELAMHKGPLIGVGFVVTAENWKEVLLACERAKDAGADNFRISGVFQSDGAAYFAGFYKEAASLCQEATEAFGSATFRVFNMFGDRVQDLQQAHPDYAFCGYQHFTTYIGGDQNVYRCCNLAYNPRGLIGSVKGQRFRDLWDSAAKEDDFAAFDARGCPRCQFNHKNRTIAYALDPNPTHANFV